MATYEEAVREAADFAREHNRHSVVAKSPYRRVYYHLGWTLEVVPQSADIRAVVLPNGRVLEYIGARVTAEGAVQA
jgi:hypothetical protein